jgi:hypothetical protein
MPVTRIAIRDGKSADYWWSGTWDRQTSCPLVF